MTQELTPKPREGPPPLFRPYLLATCLRSPLTCTRLHLQKLEGQAGCTFRAGHRCREGDAHRYPPGSVLISRSPPALSRRLGFEEKGHLFYFPPNFHVVLCWEFFQRDRSHRVMNNLSASCPTLHAWHEKAVVRLELCTSTCVGRPSGKMRAIPLE